MRVACTDSRNQAGIGNAPGDFIHSTVPRMEKTLKVNTMGAITVTHAFLRDMMKRKRGHIVTLASAASFLQCPTALDYSVSKVSWRRFSFT